MADLQGKIALVTGASQGIGRACALELAKAGAKVALAARNETKLAEVAAEIAAAGGEAAAFALDVASEESIKNGREGGHRPLREGRNPGQQRGHYARRSDDAHET